MIPCSMDEILSITGDDPAVRGVGGARRGAAWHDGPTVAFTGLDAQDRVRVLVALGPDVAGLVMAVRGEVPAGTQVIVPRGSSLPLAEPVEWNFRAAFGAPPPQPVEGSVAWEDDHEAIVGLLTLTSPDSSSWPGDGRARRWAGIRENGRLVACLGDTTAVPGVGHISAIAVHPGERGRALGRSITAWATRRLLAEDHDVVTLGVYAENAVALRMYDRLGFTVDRAFTTGVLKTND